MDIEQRTDAGRLELHLIAHEEIIEFVAQALATLIEGDCGFRREDFGERGKARGHGQRIVVERAGMRQRLRPGGIELFHDVAPPAKGAKGHAAADIFSERLEIRRDAELGDDAGDLGFRT